MTQLSDAVKQKLAGLVPEGYDVDNTRVVIASGTCAPLEGLTAEEEATLAEVTKAKGPKKITDGRPTLMRVVAWMVHEGVNRNRDGFVKEELEAVASRISSRNPMVMDWNHSAVLGGEDKIIGVWTKATYAFDAKAKNGAGAWGLLVEGVMFAWLFPDLADAMLADQSRTGSIRFSMACIPASVEFAQDSEGMYAVLHNPVFFTNSALDVPPGDPDAVGVGQEAADQPGAEDALRQKLTASLAIALNIDTLASTIATLIAQKLAATGDMMPNKTQAELDAAKLATEKAEAERLEAEKKTADEKAEAERVEAEKKAADEKAEAERKAAEVEAAKTAEEKLATAQTRITELETTNTALQTANTDLAAANEALEKEVEELTAKLDAIDAEKVTVETAAKLAARLEELPATYFAAHQQLDEAERAKVEERWMTLDDAAWKEKVADLEKAAPKGIKIGSYRERSERTPRLPAGTTATKQSITDRVRTITRA